jgi:hypothetical protein
MFPLAFASFAASSVPPAPPTYGSGGQGKKRRYGARNAKSGPDELQCSNCQAPYSTSEARVQRGLKQFFNMSRAQKNTETPRLCWVCSRLYYSSREVEGIDKIWNAFSDRGLAE